MFQKTGGNTSWHKACWDSWHKGYNVAYNHCTKMNERFNLPSPHDIYWATTDGAVNGTPGQIELLRKVSMQLGLPIQTASQKPKRSIEADAFRRKDA